MTRHKTYEEYHDLLGDGKIIIYKRSDNRSPYYQTRLKLDGLKNKYINKSTKTSNLDESKKISLKLFYEYQEKIFKGENLKRNTTFRDLFDDYWTNQILTNPDHSLRWRDSIESWNRNHLDPYFGNTPLIEIDEGTISSFIQTRIERDKPLSSQSLKHLLSLFRRILNYGLRKKMIDDIPTFKIPKPKKNLRPEITKSQWTKIHTHLRHEYQRTKHTKIYRDRFYFYHYILILYNTGIRIGEIREITWNNLSSVKDKDQNEQIVLNIFGKTGERNTIIKGYIERYFERLWNFRSQEINGTPPTTEYIFCRRDGSKTGTFQKKWDTMIREIDLEYDDRGRKRTLYSLRHSYINNLLEEGIPIWEISLNTGTSLQMIESYYGKNRLKEKHFVSSLTRSNLNLPQSSDRLKWMR